MRWFALSLASSVLLPLALPNDLFDTGQPILALVALVPLFLAYREANSPRQAIRIAVVFAVGSTFLANYWLMYFGEFSVWTIGGVISAYVLFHLLVGPILWALSIAATPWRPFVLALAWVSYEYLTSIGYLGYPWGLIAYPASGILVFLQQAELFGVWSLSFLVAAANGVVSELFYTESSRLLTPGILTRDVERQTQHDRAHRRRLLLRQAAIVLSLIIAALIFGWSRLSTPIPVRATLDAVLVQQNTDSWARSGPEEALLVAQQLTREGINAEDSPPDIVVWSETSLRLPYIERRRYYELEPTGDTFAQFIDEIDTPLLTGSAYVLNAAEQEYLNATILIDTEGEVVDYYGKQHPVPFAEHVPFWEIDAVKRFFREVIGLQAIWVIGDRYTVFEVETQDGTHVTFGTPICFEDSFSYIGRGFALRGADLLINLTNNSWSRTESAQIQHFVAARFRAIENRRTLVRSTNSGLTAIVDAYGRVIAKLPMFEQGYLRAKVPVYVPSTPTAYTMFGDYLPRVFLAILFILAVRFRLSLRKSASRAHRQKSRRP